MDETGPSEAHGSHVEGWISTQVAVLYLARRRAGGGRPRPTRFAQVRHPADVLRSNRGLEGLAGKNGTLRLSPVSAFRQRTSAGALARAEAEAARRAGRTPRETLGTRHAGRRRRPLISAQAACRMTLGDLVTGEVLASAPRVRRRLDVARIREGASAAGRTSKVPRRSNGRRCDPFL